MSKWVRTGDTEVEKITLVVKRGADPDIYDWLQSIPYGKTNAYIKAALRVAIQGGGLAPPVHRSPGAIREEAASVQKHHPQVPVVQAPPRVEPEPVAQTRIEQHVEQHGASSLGVEIDPHTLALMREMEGRF